MGCPEAKAKSGGWWEDLELDLRSAMATRPFEELRLLPLKLENRKLIFIYAGSLYECHLWVLNGAAAAAAKVTDAE